MSKLVAVRMPDDLLAEIDKSDFGRSVFIIAAVREYIEGKGKPEKMIIARDPKPAKVERPIDRESPKPAEIEKPRRVCRACLRPMEAATGGIACFNSQCQKWRIVVTP